MKERLTGAIILVVLIVLLVPELLSGPSRSAPASRGTTAPAPASSEEPPLRSYTIDLADEGHNATPSAGTSGAPPGASGPAQPSTIVEHPAQDPASAQQPETSTSSPPSPPASQAPQHPVQTPVPAAAEPPREPPPREPMQPARQPPPVAQHSVDRPPAPQQHYAAGEKRSSPEHAAKSGGWTVQVGVFAKQANAERLVKELQEQGFHTSVSENTSGGRTLYWVRTAPMAERATAEQLSARLRAAGHVGSVVPK